MAYNEEYYLANNPDVAIAVRKGGFGSGWVHYNATGKTEGRSFANPYGVTGFDEEYYLANNPDVAKAVEAGAIASGWVHYNANGKTEGRSFSAPASYGTFSDEYYLANNPDVATAVRQGLIGSGWEHYQANGQAEGRSFANPYGATGFDEEYYLANNQDVGKAVEVGAIASGWVHYNANGKTEGRSFANPYPADGQSFTLTNNPTPDSLILTVGNDTVTGAAGTLATGDLIIDSTTTDADIANLTASSYAQNAVEPTISNVEALNLIGSFTTIGLDLTNITGAKTVNLSAGIAGGTGTIDDVTLAKLATGVVAGANISTLNVNTGTAAAFTAGTGGNINIDRGTATTVSIGNIGNTGSDTYTVNSVTNGTTILRGGSGGTDTFTVDLVGGASTLTITNSAAATADINVLNLNSNVSANTVTLSSALDEVVANTSTDKILVGGTQALTIVGAAEVVSGASARTAATQGGIVTKAAGAGTLTFQSNGALSAPGFFNNAQFDVISNNTAFGFNATFNQATKVKLVTAEGAARIFDVDNPSVSTALTAGAGTLQVDLAGTSVANAIQVGITTGVGVGTLILTNNTIGSTITTLDTNTTAGTVDNVVVSSGTTALTIGTWTATANETLSATNMTGTLTATIGANAATVIGGSGNDVLTGGAAADSLRGGIGDDTVNGGASADTVTGGTGNDRFVLANAATVDTIADFSVSGANGVDVVAFAVGTATLVGAGLTLTAVKDGAAAAVAAGNAVTVKHVAAATTLAASQNVFVIDGTFASAAALETAIETGGTRQLTFGAAPTAGDDILVVWTDGTNGHIGGYNLTTVALTPIAADTYTELVTLTGVTDVTALTSANFLITT